MHRNGGQTLGRYPSPWPGLPEWYVFVESYQTSYYDEPVGN
jgi:hypothetical protein